jgi:allantoicase
MTPPAVFTHLPDLAAARLGGAVLAANDDFFAPKENLIREAEPVWIADKYTERGKWMDGWETRRRREPGYDWCVVRLGLPGIVRGVVVDTRHFTGNYPEFCAIDPILEKSPLRGDARNEFAITDPHRHAELRLDIFPDGGVARLRVHGEVVPEPQALAGEVDLAAITLGARVTGVSDAFYGQPQKLLWPGPATHMGDGWETKRRRGPGNDWVELELACEGALRRIDVDTSHFKGNAPGWCSLTADDDRPLVERAALKADDLRAFEVDGTTRRLRLDVFPDGGVARLRVWGTPTAAGREAIGLRWLNALPPDEAQEALRSVCASRRWTAAMAATRPYADLRALAAAAERVDGTLEAGDWREAFTAHPRLGDSSGSAWSRQEQAGTAAASSDVLARLRAANQRYEERFGHVFLLCATGMSAGEMLAEVERRSTNDAATELQNAAREQGKITRLRLHKLLGVPT